MENIIVANIFSALGALLLCISTFSKRKDNMLYIQTGDCFFYSLACFFAGSYSGSTTYLINCVRNIINAKGKMTKPIMALISFLIFTIGMICNTKGFVGILGPVAAVQYTIWSSLAKTSQQIRYGLVLNLAMWEIHDIKMRLYPSAITYLVIIIVTIINIIRKK